MLRYLYCLCIRFYLRSISQWSTLHQRISNEFKCFGQVIPRNWLPDRQVAPETSCWALCTYIWFSQCGHRWFWHHHGNTNRIFTLISWQLQYLITIWLLNLKVTVLAKQGFWTPDYPFLDIYPWISLRCSPLPLPPSNPRNILVMTHFTFQYLDKIGFPGF